MTLLHNSQSSASLSSLRNDDVSLPDVEKSPSRTSVVSIGPPPDGGWLAWAQVLAGFFCSFNSWGFANSFGVFQHYYISSDILRGETESRIAWIGTLNAVLAFFGSVFFSFLVDKGWTREMVVVSSVISSFSLMMLSISKEYWQIMLTQGFLNGICSSVLFTVGISAVAPYFSHRRGIALGCTAAGSSVGGLIYSITSQRLLDSVGFGWTCRANAFILLGTGVGTGILIKPRIPPRKTRDFFATECFGELAWMIYCFAMLFGFIGFYCFYNFYQSYALSMFEDKNDPSLTYLSAIINAGAVAGRIFPSLLTDYVGPFNVLVPFTLMSCVLSLCWLAAESKGGIIAVGVIFGFFSAPITLAPGIVTAKLTKNLNRMGIRLSFSFIFFSVGVLLGAPFAGMIVRSHGYFGAKLYTAFAWLACTTLFAVSRQIQLGKKVVAKC